ncbi:MAG: Tagatose-bisphosphate aldolase [Candidatus Taylorbacteria bacterium]|nr:Tagatose-bisphosphate aldolase [Candidatus Taylorbacteria bacterium]
MQTKSLKQYIIEAKEKGVAIGHFNISNLEALHAIFNAAKALSVPVIIGVSEGERDFVGVHEAVALVKTLREENDYPIFLNADHTYSFDRVKEAIDAGYDSVIFDGAKLTLDENIVIAKQCVEYAKNCGREVLVEAELGYIGQSSKILDAVPDGVELTSVADAEKFVKETGVDLFAPAVGNIHGMLKDIPDPRLNIERVGEISKATGVPLVLHGASGNSKEDIQDAIKNGVAIVHINTEIRVAFHDALVKEVQDNPGEVAPYKMLKPSLEAVQKVVTDKLKFFNFLD